MSTIKTPLFEPVIWEGTRFRILDETLLPEAIQYLEIDDVDQAIDAVRDMKTRAFGQVLTFLYSAALLAERNRTADKESLWQMLTEMTGRFSAARPTFDFKGISQFFTPWFEPSGNDGKPGQTIGTNARTFAQQIVAGRKARARRAAGLLPERARVLTHCNISGELVAIAQYAMESGKQISVVATETRPYLQGSRLTAWELAEAGVLVSVVPDCAIAQVFARSDVDAVIVGADRIAQNGDVINKVGTYPLALMAREYGVPFYALVQNPGSLVSGKDVEIEERPGAELLDFQGRQLVCEKAENLAVRYPAFDVTAGTLITRLVGFDDVFTLEKFQEKYLKGVSVSIAKNSPARYLLVFGVPRKENYDFLIHALRAEEADRILVPEMRPSLDGPRIVARELLRRNAPVTLISDNMIGALFGQDEIRKVYLSYLDLGETGPKAACGSLLVARLSRLHGIQVELQPADENAPSGPDRDVTTFLGEPILPAGASAYPIKEEALPWDLLRAEKQ